VILADSSVLIAVFRGIHSPPADRLRAIVRDGTSFGIPAVCVQEVLQGARDEAEWKRLRAILETQLLAVPADPREAHVAAARIYYDCRRKGLTVRSSTDCLIAQIALEEDAVLLHDDDDFETIRKVRPLRTLRG